jgi:hypothetical protein
MYHSAAHLDACNNTCRLNSKNVLSGESTAQVGIIREAFPIATTFCNSTQRANNRPKGDIDALGPELSTHIHTSCVGEVFIPARSHRYA